ncbi:MAG: ChpI protein [Chloroflexi bacterium]|nr:MAG: ChpI protein [Chloroflexota bacterium]
MKTAISIPTPLFQAAEKRARKLGMSRSQLYAQALERLLDQDPDDEVTRALDAVYSKEKSAVDRDLAAAQRRATAEKW